MVHGGILQLLILTVSPSKLSQCLQNLFYIIKFNDYNLFQKKQNIFLTEYGNIYICMSVC